MAKSFTQPAVVMVVPIIKYENSTMKYQPRLICFDNSFLEMEMEESSNRPGLSLFNDCDNEDVGDNAADDDEDDDGNDTCYGKASA